MVVDGVGVNSAHYQPYANYTHGAGQITLCQYLTLVGTLAGTLAMTKMFQ